jgi:hypothetical protein
LVGLRGHERIHGGSLADFVAINRLSEVQTYEDAGEANEVVPLPEDVAEASKNFSRYDVRNGGNVSEQSKWDELFRSILRDKVAAGLQDDYGQDLLKLSNQLARSKGTPLSDERVFQLIEYHVDGFLASAQAQQDARSTRLAASMSKLVLAGAAFVIFVLVLFSFIFVKIERNLRRDPPSAQSPEWGE